MKKTLLLLATLLLGFFASAQTQHGYVKTLGRPEKKGEALSGVTVRVKGQHNAILSNDDGTFSIPMVDMKNGDAYFLQQVQKNGYELNEIGWTPYRLFRQGPSGHRHGLVGATAG